MWVIWSKEREVSTIFRDSADVCGESGVEQDWRNCNRVEDIY